jgi:hypothetical protein
VGTVRGSDRGRLGLTHRALELLVAEHRDLAGRVDRKKLGPLVLALREVHGDQLELNIRLAQRPEDADRTGRREPIELMASSKVAPLGPRRSHLAAAGSPVPANFGALPPVPRAVGAWHAT